MKDRLEMCRQAEQFVHTALNNIFVKPDRYSIREILHEDIMWIGSGRNEIYENAEAVLVFLTSDNFTSQVSCEINCRSLSCKAVSDHEYMVAGEFGMRKIGKNTIMMNTDVRFSLLCVMQDKGWKLFHAHWSVPNTIQDEALYLSEKRYEIAMQSSGLTMFEYNILTRDLLLFEDTAENYGVPTLIPDGMETFIVKRIIEPESEQDYREMYRKIHEGEPYAKCFVKSRDINGTVHDYELSLTTVFDTDHNPIRAIGVRKNVSQIITLQKENEFARTMISRKKLVFQANITTDRLEYADEEWQKVFPDITVISYREAVSYMVKALACQEHQDVLNTNLSGSFLQETFQTGKSLVEFEYKRVDGNGHYAWYEAVVNIIRDGLTNDVIIRFYQQNINEKKLREHRAAEERVLYESMIANAKLAYEVNITKNLAIKGHEKWYLIYGIRQSDDYSRMIEEFAQKAVYPEDADKFLAALNRRYVMKQYKKGRRLIVCQYRKKDQDGFYRWVDCTLHLYEDADNGDVKGFCYVEDIDDKKKEELSLRYNAEHDLMTGILNKAMTEKKICEYLNSEKSMGGKHAFLIVDIDHFKTVNDNFGHMFGDTVIQETASKISSIFRKDDIIGRIGGDEFGIFMKHIKSGQEAEKRAGKICEIIYRQFTQNGKAGTVSVSVGIALCEEAGMTYEELFRQADQKLYQAKNNGRNHYEV